MRRAQSAGPLSPAVDLVTGAADELLRLAPQERGLGLVDGHDPEGAVNDDEAVRDPVEDGLELPLALPDLALELREPPPADAAYEPADRDARGQHDRGKQKRMLPGLDALGKHWGKLQALLDRASPAPGGNRTIERPGARRRHGSAKRQRCQGRTPLATAGCRVPAATAGLNPLDTTPARTY
jgi:hypothetical protein